MNRYAFAMIAVMTASLAVPGYAGDQYIDRTGYAVSGYDVVAYRSLAQNPVGKTQPKAVPGKAEITTEYNGAKFAFATETNRDTFLKNPARFVPQYDGHCAYGVAVGNKVPANPHLWRIVDDKLYLNITKDIARTWDRNVPGYIKSSDRKWGRLESRRASRDRIPGFSSKAPNGS